MPLKVQVIHVVHLAPETGDTLNETFVVFIYQCCVFEKPVYFFQ
jgi:hypothetical protein